MLKLNFLKNGKVDHIVATDAIGLGLNLNIKNIFFSSIKKFDGQRERKLTYDEISQIAGRAGRYLNDGFFWYNWKFEVIESGVNKFC